MVYDRRNVCRGAAIYIVYEGHCVKQEHCRVVKQVFE